MYTQRRHPRGLNLIEAMFLLVVMSIIAVAAGVSLQAVAKVPAITDDIMAVNNAMVNTSEQVRANMIASWPTTTFVSPVVIAGTTYTPSVTIRNAGYNYGAPPTYTTVTSSLSLNSKTYQLSLAVDQADPANGSTYKTDYYRVTVSVTPYINGSLATTGQRTMVSYVTQP